MSTARPGRTGDRLPAAFRHAARALPFAAAVALAAAAVVHALPASYRATVRVAVSPAAEPAPVAADDDALAQQLALLRSRDLALDVIRALQLWDDPALDPRPRRDGWTWTARLAVQGDRADRTWNEPTLAAAVWPAFHRATEVRAADTGVVDIAFTTASPTRAAQIADALADAHLRREQGAACHATPPAGIDVGQQLAALRRQLEELDRLLRAALRPTPAALAEARPQRLAPTMAPASMGGSERGRVQADNPAAVMRHPSMADALAREAAAAKRLDELFLRYDVQHPQVIEATAELQAARQHLATRSEAVAREWRAEREAALATERQREAELARSRKAADAAAVAAATAAVQPLEPVLRKLAAEREQLDRTLARITAEGDARAASGPVPRPRVLQYAAAGTPVSPRRGPIVAVAFFAAFAIGWGASLGLSALSAARVQRSAS